MVGLKDIRKLNRCDWGIIIIIAAGACGGLFSPLTIQRLISIILITFVLKEFSNKSFLIPSFIKTFFIIWFVFSIISLIWTPDRTNGIKFLLYNLCSYIDFIAIIFFSFKATNAIRSILIGWLLLIIITAPIAIWEIVSNSHLPISVQDSSAIILNSLGERTSRIFASVTYGNLNTYVLVLVYCIPYVLMSIGFFKKDKIYPWIALAFIIFVILINASRGGILCLSAALIYTNFSFVRHKIISRPFAICSFILLFILIFFNSDFLFNQIAGRMLESKLTADESRIEVYERGLEILKSSLGLGCGIGGLQVSLEALGGIARISAMHNMFLEFLVQYGIIPFVFFILFIFGIIKQLIFSAVHIKNFIGWIFILLVVPMSIINSGYLTDAMLWIYFSSIYVIGRFPLSPKSRHR